MSAPKNTSEKPIVIVGGGFAGVEAAIALRKKKHEVTLVSDRDYFFVYPISIWIPTSGISFDNSSISLHKLAKRHGFSLVVDRLEKVNPKGESIELSNQTLQYSYLLLATGAAKMKHKGLEHTFSICGNPKQAIALQQRFEELISRGSGKIAIGFGGNPKDKSGVRGGPAFEILFNLQNKLRSLGIEKQYQFTFFAPMPEPGKRMGKSGLLMLDKMLDKNNIEKRVGKKITGFEENGIHVEDGSFIESDLTMFIAASTGAEFLQNSELPLNESGFVQTDDHSLVLGYNNIYAIGDVAAMNGPEWKAKQGHMAVVMGRNAAYNIHQQITQSNKRKGYLEHVNILCVMDTGKGAAYVYRKGPTDYVIPMPVFGHWLKKAWGWYYKFSVMHGIQL